MKIFNKKLKKNNSIFFIAEIGVNHCGNLKLAKKMILAAKSANADAVKFQTFKADEFIKKNTPKVKYQKKNSKNKESHFDMIKKLELSDRSHLKLIKYCKKININFLSTPYNKKSAQYLNKIGCKVIKTASADIVDLELHEYLARKNKTVLISTGMSNLKEIEQCVNIYKKYKNKKFILLHCVSSYPTSHKSINLLSLKTISSKFNCLVGFSDHSQGSFASMASVALGGVVVEKHFTTSKKLSGPDHKTSCLPNEFKKLVEDVNNFKKILGSEEKKCQPEEKEMKLISRKSLTLNKSLNKGEIIESNFLTLKRPGNGLYYINLKKIVGKKARKNLHKDHQINFKDLI